MTCGARMIALALLALATCAQAGEECLLYSERCRCVHAAPCDKAHFTYRSEQEYDEDEAKKRDAALKRSLQAGGDEYDCRKAVRLHIGMTSDEVQATCLGEPFHVDQLQSMLGITEQWTYRSWDL